MCSRYFLDADGNVIAYTFGVPVHGGIRKRFNIAPTHEAPVIRAGEGGTREVALLRWGLVPSWAKELSIGSKLINARAETLAEKPSFRAAFRSRRCIVPASGFFEWTGEPRWRVPHAITVAGRPLVPFAGLWESWRTPQGPVLETYTIVTTAANGFVSGMHDRMPAILEERDIDAWLGGSVEDARSVLKPYADGPMREHAVSRALNSPDAEPESLPAPAAEGEPPDASKKGGPRDDPRQQSLGFD
ncbi:MAG TPA: SOS response-associated peptidase [Usitatibacter sp.]|jgi:putative SOS response-associated peptidase YedK|nr:SOS response-associated peptidase [Usitatibacter sp.]